MFGLSAEYTKYAAYFRRIGIFCRMIHTLVLLEHLLGYLLLPEFLAELALVIPPGLAHAILAELALSLVLAHSLDSPDLECALFGGHPPVLAAWYYITMVAQHKG